MVKQLSPAELAGAIFIALGVTLAGIVMAVSGGSDPLGIHGMMIALYAGALLLVLFTASSGPEPTEDREASYYDDPIKVGIALAMVWAVFGMFMGVWVAAQLAWPDLAFDAAWSSFGRLRPTHTTGVIFGFGGNALIATSFHVVQRTSRARLAGQISPWFVLFGYNLFCVLAVSGYLHGRHPVQGVRRSRMVRRHLAGDRVGHLLRSLHPHDRAPERAAHLRRQLVLHGLHPGCRHPSHRQQPRPSSILGLTPRATRSGPACRTRWCSGGTGTMPSLSS